MTLDSGLPPELLHLTRDSVEWRAFVWRVVNDSRFAAEMRFCNEHAIPHSQFLSWPEDDRAKALAFEQWEAMRCRRCGMHPMLWPEDSTDPPYTVDAHRCQGCREQEKFENSLPKGASKTGLRLEWEKLPGTPTVPGLPVEEE